MLKRLCPICGQVHDQGQPCPRAKERHKEYDKARRDETAAAFYHSPEWKILKTLVRDRAHHLDQYQYVANHVIRLGNIVHHIRPIDEYPEGRLDPDNCIYVSKETHNMIHHRYDNGGKEEMQARLKMILKYWR